MNNWQDFYNSIKAESWPECTNEENFDTLPENIKQECIEVFGYSPGFYAIKKQLIKNKSFCVLPFIHLYVSELNDISPCCHGLPIKQYSDNFDFYQDNSFIRLREQMKKGVKVNECKSCYSVEEGGGESVRIRNTQDWAKKLQITDLDQIETKLRYYDIRNDNLCNLACRTCKPASSTQLEKEYKELKWFVIKNSSKPQLSEIIDYDTVERVYVAGGEPTIMPEFTKFLNKAIEHNKTDIELTVITNGTNFNKNIFSLLSNFKNTFFTISIDGFGDVNKYIRWPSDWNTLTKNIKKIITISPNISVNVTVSMYNVIKLYDLIVYLESVLPSPATILLNQASPEHFSPFNFPNKELAISRLEKLKCTNSYKNEQHFSSQVNYFINMIKKSVVNIDNLNKFFTYNDALDQHRKVFLVDYIPEVDACRQYIYECGYHTQNE